MATRTVLRLIAVAALASACGRETPAPAPAAGASSLPLDRVAPDEVSEGQDKAWGLTLPRQMKVESRFADRVVATGDVPVDAAANYFRARVKDGKSVVGASQTIFEHVKPKADPSHDLYIRVDSAKNGKACRVTIYDTTPTPSSLAPDQATQMKNVGLTPQGKLADPKHLD
jgi:hypothetical protein